MLRRGDGVGSERTCLSNKVDSWKQEATKFKDDGLKWCITPNKYISYLHYLLNLVMDNFPEDVVVVVRYVLSDYGVKVGPKNPRIGKLESPPPSKRLEKAEQGQKQQEQGRCNMRT